MDFELLKKLYLLCYGKCTTCKGCVFYTGVECHGHGDYWGTCLLSYEVYKYCVENIKDYDVSYFDCIVYDDSHCILSKFIIFRGLCNDK